MTYLVQSWTRCESGFGEESLRSIRVRHYSNVAEILKTLALDWSVCRVTLSSSTSVVVWDLYRTAGRDRQLDASMRSAIDLNASVSAAKLDIGPGVTQEQLAEAVAQLVTIPGKL